ncbi:MAG: hypothetical protein J6I76_22175, partial [Oribacterium sp.]|nr:hypothetical protein [Oribacterium sp.]MBP3806562.1 hypothetical protein [Oribacterium sp.]
GFDVMDIGDGVLNRRELTSYLSEDNVLVVKYTSAEQNSGIDERRYLPMITVTVIENVAVINQILEADGMGEGENPSTVPEGTGPYSADVYGTVVVEETAPSVANIPNESYADGGNVSETAETAESAADTGESSAAGT